MLIRLLSSFLLAIRTRDVEAAISSTAFASMFIASANKKRENDRRPFTIFLKLLLVCSLPSLTLYHFEETKT